MVLNWFSSFLKNRTFSVIIDDFSSDTAYLTSGIPQGSTLAHLLFSLYMSPLASIISRHNVYFHFYVDDIQIYMLLVLSDPNVLTPLYDCIQDIKNWPAQNFLHLRIYLYQPRSSHTCVQFTCPCPCTHRRGKKPGSDISYWF